MSIRDKINAAGTKNALIAVLNECKAIINDGLVSARTVRQWKKAGREKMLSFLPPNNKNNEHKKESGKKSRYEVS